ncbi:hypothetical protein L9F63_013574, partial [Diploptera punctata]
MDCPSWNTGEWSGCSVSCGEGIQTRHVQCRDARNMPSLLCDPVAQPGPTQLCNTGIACPVYHNSFYDAVVQPYPPPSSGHIPHKAAAERLIGGSEQVVPSESTSFFVRRNTIRSITFSTIPCGFPTRCQRITNLQAEDGAYAPKLTIVNN